MDYGLLGFEEIGLIPYYKTDGAIQQGNNRLIKTAGRKAFAWWSEPPHTNAAVAIYFHGNAENISTRTKRLTQLQAAGFGVLGLSYTGFASSKRARDYDNQRTQPSEHMLYEDARAAINFLHREGITDSQMVFIGESLGSAVAVQMATETPPRAVVLDCPFTSVAARSQEIYWWLPAYWMVWDRFDNAKKIKRVKAPTMIIGATEDAVIPVEHAIELAAVAGPNATLKIFDDMPHVGLPAHEFAAIIRAFITPKQTIGVKDEKTDSPPPR